MAALYHLRAATPSPHEPTGKVEEPAASRVGQVPARKRQTIVVLQRKRAAVGLAHLLGSA